MRHDIVLLGLLLIMMVGCSKNMATCWTQGDGANVHAEFGYFYDSAMITSTGPSSWKRIPKEFAFDPCSGVELPKDAPPL